MRTSATKRLSAKEKARIKQINAIKTSIPLVATLVLLALVYVWVLLPDSPKVVLQKAIYNTLDTTKQKSWRYDGSFGDQDAGLAAEYSGQKASNGDSDFSLKLTASSKTLTYSSARTGGFSYYKIAGIDALPEILHAMPGVKNPDDDMLSLLKAVDGKWVRVSGTGTTVVDKLFPCADHDLSLPNGQDLKEFAYTKSPIEISAGPFAANDGSQDRVFEVRLKDNHQASDFETRISSYITCLGDNQSSDYRLRSVTSGDVASLKATVTVNPLTNVVNKLVYKQFSKYFQLTPRDFNKDVTITAPSGAIPLNDLLLTLDPQIVSRLSM